MFNLQMGEAGWGELHHLMVLDARARAPRHRDAIAGRAARRGGEQIGAPRAAGGEDRRVGGERLDMIGGAVDGVDAPRSEEHTSELQSLMRNSYAVFCLTKQTIHK